MAGLTTRFRCILRLIPICLTLAFAMPAAGQEINFSPFTEIDPRDPLELSTGTVIDGTATILALFEDPDPNELNQLVAFNVPVGDPGSAVSQNVPTSSSTIFALSHKIHRNSTGTAFASIIDDTDASNPPFELVSLRTTDGLNWMRTTVASGVDYRSSETGLGPNDEVYVAGLDATNLEVDIFVSTDGGLTFQPHRTITAQPGSVGIVGAAFGAQRMGFGVADNGSDCAFYAELLASGTRVELRVSCSPVPAGGGALVARGAANGDLEQAFDEDVFPQETPGESIVVADEDDMTYVYRNEEDEQLRAANAEVQDSTLGPPSIEELLELEEELFPGGCGFGLGRFGIIGVIAIFSDFITPEQAAQELEEAIAFGETLLFADDELVAATCGNDEAPGLPEDTDGWVAKQGNSVIFATFRIIPAASAVPVPALATPMKILAILVVLAIGMISIRYRFRIRQHREAR